MSTPKPPTCTRRIEFDAGHRVLRHESKCLNPHGHRYTVELTCGTEALDDIGRVIDFSDVKTIVGGWVDDALDHGYIGHPDDEVLHAHRAAGFKTYEMPRDLGNPTAENMALLIKREAAALLAPRGITVEHVRVYETPNGWADA